MGAVARQFLNELDINIYSHVVQVGNIKSKTWNQIKADSPERFSSEAAKEQYFAELDKTPLRCGDGQKTAEMIELIDSWKENGDSVGGVFEIVVSGVPVGIGSHVHWGFKN